MKNSFMSVLGFDIGIINFSGCLVTRADNKTRSAFVLNIGERKDPLEKILTSLASKMNEMRDVFAPPDLIRVVIEQQLGIHATKNFAISAALYMYYADLRLNKPELEIVFSNPRRKFTLLSQMEDVPGVSEHYSKIKSTKGPQLKRLSVEMSTALATLVDDRVFLDYMNSSKKKDDISDAWLMATLC
jgi:hypothetical protein